MGLSLDTAFLEILMIIPKACAPLILGAIVIFRSDFAFFLSKKAFQLALQQ